MNGFLPYGRQSIDADDIAAVVRVLESDWLTQGPVVEAFEGAFASAVGARHAVAVNSGTAALHAAMAALHVGPGDEVIVPSITFTATANCAVFQGATPVFADVDPGTLTLDPASVAERITPRTKVIIGVDYAGHPCDVDALQALADRHGITLVADACHALGATYRGRPVGSLARLNTFSFHPVKHIATGEGGMITTDDAAIAQRMRDFRTHGITKDAARSRSPEACPLTAEKGPWYYEMHELGYNYRMSDINAALGLSQLGKLAQFVRRRREIAAIYAAQWAGLPGLTLPAVRDWADPSWHLYPVRIDFRRLGKTRTEVMAALRAKGVGTQVHYIPVHLQPFYRERYGYGPGLCPRAEAVYAGLLSMPMYPAMTDEDVQRVVDAVVRVMGGGG